MGDTNPKPSRSATKNVRPPTPPKWRILSSLLPRRFSRNKHAAVGGTGHGAPTSSAMAPPKQTTDDLVDRTPKMAGDGGAGITPEPAAGGAALTCGDMVLPDLSDDIIGEILLRVHVVLEPRFLMSVSLVCKRWRRIVSDPAFRSRYREIHRARLKTVFDKMFANMTIS
ncbi:hypothetical protein ACP70R_014586 [Stipagrostis hirtigluma subsp. patula]